MAEQLIILDPTLTPARRPVSRSRAAACRAIPPDTRPVAPGPLTISGSQVNWRELPWE